MTVRPSAIVVVPAGLAGAVLCLIGVGVTRAVAEETLAERRVRVEQMDPQEREQLAQNYERFQRLDRAEQQRLRVLQEEIDADPQRDELLKTMQAYHEWLAELPSSQRIMLSALPAEERLKRIDEFAAPSRRAGETGSIRPTSRCSTPGWRNMNSKSVGARLNATAAPRRSSPRS